MTAKSVPAPTTLPTRPPPPRDLRGEAKALWRNVVAAYPVDHFSAANLALLHSLCMSHALIRKCDKMIARQAFRAGRPHPAIAVRVVERRIFMSLSTKLRLPVSATFRADAAIARPDTRNALRKPWERA